MEDKNEAARRIIVALDVENEKEAYELVKLLSPPVNCYKVGMRLYTACGPRIIKGLKELGVKVFLDLKFHDIPNTVAATAEVVAGLGVDMFNIHLSGGRKMILAAVKAARQSAEKAGRAKPLLLGVTALTSLNEKMLNEELGIGKQLEQYVVDLSLMGQESGIDGVVASPREAALIRKRCGDGFFIITPGVRPLWAASGDQQRVFTPRLAMEAGADYIVIGRPIIQHRFPREALQMVLSEITAQNS